MLGVFEICQVYGFSCIQGTMEKHFYGQNILIENALRFYLFIYAIAWLRIVICKAWYNLPMNIL